MIEDDKMRKRENPGHFPPFCVLISHLLLLASHVCFVYLQADILYYSGRILELYMTRQLLICLCFIIFIYGWRTALSCAEWYEKLNA